MKDLGQRFQAVYLAWSGPADQVVVKWVNFAFLDRFNFFPAFACYHVLRLDVAIGVVAEQDDVWVLLNQGFNAHLGPIAVQNVAYIEPACHVD